MIAQELEVSLHMAFVEARQQRHEFITVEHLLLALLDNPSAAEVLRACSANIDDLRGSLTNFIKDNTPRSMPLAATIALEHYTALMGDMLLRHPEQLAGSQVDYERMWRWHALEEVEHKAVAYDVYEKCIGRGPRNWLERSGAMIAATGLFWPIVVSFYWQMSRADPKCRAEGWRGHLKVLDFSIGRQGYIRRLVPEFLSYFKYSFHPWQQNNAHLLAELDALVDDAEAAYATHH